MDSNFALKFRRLRRVARYALALCLALVSFPSADADTISVSQREILRVFDMAASYHHQRTVLRKVVDAACYFDPEVEHSMGCSWFSSSDGTDSDRLEQKVEQTSKTRCKQAGGRNCVVLWWNGTLWFDGLHPVQAERIESALLSMTTWDDEALPLPEGGIVPFGLQRRFEAVREHWEKSRREYRGRDPHYVVCANDRGPWTSSFMHGREIHIAHARAACVLKCKAYSEFLSKEGECYVVYEDGKFASPAAKRALPAAVAAPIPVVAAEPAPTAEPAPAGANVVVDRYTLTKVLGNAATDYFHRTVKRNIIETACYFDPKAVTSMSCGFRGAGRNSGAIPFYMRKVVRSRLMSFCKEAGGSNCTLFTQNGELEFAGLSSEQSEKLESALRSLPSYDAEAKPLPDDVHLASRFRTWFPGARDHFEELHRKNRFKNLHYAICANRAGTYSWSSAQGPGVEIPQIRTACALSCTALAEMYSEEGECYVVYEDGKFASAAAEAALAE